MTLSDILRPRTSPSRKIRVTPKGLLLGLFAGLIALAIPYEGSTDGALNLAIAAAVAGTLDIAIYKLGRDELVLPSGALITGVIIGLILRQQEPWYVAAGASGIAIASKHAVRTRWSNILNPAAAGLVAAAVLSGAGESWWGSLPNAGVIGALVLLALGGYLAQHVNKVPMVVAFLATYFILFTASTFFLEPARSVEIYRAPDLQAALFFALFMVDDPPTSPVRFADQVLFGMIVAMSGFLLFLTKGVVYYLPAGLLIANAWESARRLIAGRKSGGFLRGKGGRLHSALKSSGSVSAGPRVHSRA